MYDFHKANDSKLIGNNAHYFEFRHPAFHKDAGNKLHKIKRKNPKHRSLPKMKYSHSMDLNAQGGELQEDEDDFEEEDEDDDDEEEDLHSPCFSEGYITNIPESDTTNPSSSNELNDMPRNHFDNERIHDMEGQRRLENIITLGNTITKNDQLPQDDLNSLMQKTEKLEWKIDGLLGHIQQLVGMVNVQGEVS